MTHDTKDSKELSIQDTTQQEHHFESVKDIKQDIAASLRSYALSDNKQFYSSIDTGFALEADHLVLRLQAALHREYRKERGETVQAEVRASLERLNYGIDHTIKITNVQNKGAVVNGHYIKVPNMKAVIEAELKKYGGDR